MANREQKETVRIYSGELFPWQITAARTLLKFPKNLVYTILAPRQVGKTHFIEMFSLSKCLNTNKEKPFRVVIVNPTFANSKRCYADFAAFTEKMPEGIVTSANASDLQIKFWNNSTIQLKSLEQSNALRGDHCDLLVLDESAFMDTATALSCLFPYVNSTRGDILLISTPTFADPQSNLFAKFWFKAKEYGNKGRYQLCDWRKFDTSAILPPETKQMLKETMPWNIYANEILGEFLSEKNELWDFGSVLRNGILPTNNMFAGLDWGSTGTDETVLAVFNEDKQMYDLLRLNGSDHDATERIKLISNYIKEHPQLKKVVYETNSIGAPLADFLKKECMRIGCKCQFIPFDTNNQTKREAIENLQLEIQNQTVTLLDDSQLKLEFSQFEMKKTKTGLITYGNRSDNVHDDIVIASAIALQAARKGNYSLK